MNPDAAGSIWIENSQVRIASLSPRKTDSIEVTADAAPGSSLLVELATGPKALPSQVRVPLADLVRHPYQLRLDDHGNTLDVRVVPTPSLQISFLGGAAQNNALIFAPGEQLAFELAPALPATLHGTTLDIQTTLSPARRKEVVWSDNQKLAVPVDGQPRIDLTVPLQVAEGVYTVHISVSRASGYFRDKFFPGAATPIAERSFQIVVVGARPAASEEVGRWKKVLEIDPTNPRWVERLPSWTQFQRIPGLNHGPLGSIRAGAADLPLGRFVELPSTVKGADPHWQAYSLPLEAVGAPHLLEIDYPADEEQHFGLSIVEPNAAGIVEGVQHDAGVYVEGLGRKEEKHEQTQRLIFWPRTQAPLLVVTNEHPTAAAHFGQIRVMKRIGPLTSRIPVTSHDRLIAAYLARPLARTSFGATEALESIVNSGAPKSVDDYQTLYQSATRLADYVQAGGFNSAIVSVLADGSSIFPNSHLQLTPRYDSGRLTERPRETDGLELMLRVFDREGLTLIPAIEFATPIPKLEELRRNSDPHISGLELVGSDGRTWLEVNGTRGGLAPYYNVLDPRVQQAMLDIVREIVARYGTHPSFGGLSVQLKGDGYTQLSTLEWGLDDSTVDRFAHDTGTQLRATGPEQLRRSYSSTNWTKRGCLAFLACQANCSILQPHGGTRAWRRPTQAGAHDRKAIR